MPHHTAVIEKLPAGDDAQQTFGVFEQNTTWPKEEEAHRDPKETHRNDCKAPVPTGSRVSNHVRV